MVKKDLKDHDLDLTVNKIDWAANIAELYGKTMKHGANTITEGTN